MKKKTNFASHIVLGILAFISLFPVYILAINALKNRQEIFKNPMNLPETWRFDNFSKAWEYGNYSIAFKNSALITSMTIIMVLFVAGLGAYALQRNNRFSRNFTVYFLACTTIPVQLFIIPLYSWFNKLGLVNNFFGVALIYTALYTPFSILLLRSYLVSIPVQLEEASRIDGATRWQYFWKVLVPVSKPAFLTIGLIVGYWSWGEFVVATTFLTESADYHTLIIKFFSLTGRYSAPWGLMMASGIMIVLPILLVFLLLQKYFVQGLTSGSIK